MYGLTWSYQYFLLWINLFIVRLFVSITFKTKQVVATNYVPSPIIVVCPDPISTSRFQEYKSANQGIM